LFGRRAVPRDVDRHLLENREAQDLENRDPTTAPLDGTTLLVVSGQLPLDAEGHLVGAGDLRAHTRQVFENLRTILEANGATFADVVKMGPS
jgi:enamine deaminase RidA (YjgF/YER057c/UK114 family)